MNMRKTSIRLAAVFMAAMLLTLSGCKTKQIVEQKPVTDAITAATKTVVKEAPSATLSIEAPQPTVTYDDAVNWARERITPLINKYMATSGNKLDPDEMRKMFAPIGYDGTNVPAYRDAERMLVDTLYGAMLKKAIQQGKTSIVIMTGTGASGKSTVTKTMDFSQKGLLYDAAFNSFRKLSAAIDRARKEGMKDITVIAVYKDFITSYKNATERGKRTNRFLGVDYLVGAFLNSQHKMELLNQKYPDIELICFDNSFDTGGKRVSREESEKWNYNVTAEEIHEVLTFLLDEINKGEIKGNQIASAAGNVLATEGLADSDKALAEEIDRRVRQGARRDY